MPKDHLDTSIKYCKVIIITFFDIRFLITSEDIILFCGNQKTFK